MAIIPSFPGAAGPRLRPPASVESCRSDLRQERPQGPKADHLISCLSALMQGRFQGGVSLGRSAAMSEA